MNQSHTQHPTFVSVTVPSRIESIRLAAEFMVHAAQNMKVPAASDSHFEVAIVEALNNAVKHGNADNKVDAFLVCELELNDRTLVVRIIDHGPGYTLARAPRPEWDPNDIASIPESGYGISIIQHVFPTVRTIGRSGEFGLEMTLEF
jgi:serine/threonine-protein kinase RsbW